MITVLRSHDLVLIAKVFFFLNVSNVYSILLVQQNMVAGIHTIIPTHTTVFKLNQMFIKAEPIIKSNSGPIDMAPDGNTGTFVMNVSISVKIIDDDFEEVVGALHYCDAIIDVYERRGLNVAANLALYIRGNGVPNIFETCKTSPGFVRYAAEVEKYLALV